MAKQFNSRGQVGVILLVIAVLVIGVGAYFVVKNASNPTGAAITNTNPSTSDTNTQTNPSTTNPVVPISQPTTSTTTNGGGGGGNDVNYGIGPQGPVPVVLAPQITSLQLVNDDSTINISGDVNSGFVLIPNGDEFLHNLNVQSLTSSTPLADEYYPFSLSAPSSTLATYFAVKVPDIAPDTLEHTQQHLMYLYLQGVAQGTNPIFYLKVSGSTYNLIDGMVRGLESPGPFSDTILRIDGKYPAGIYLYNGTLTDTSSSTNTITMQMAVSSGTPI